MKQITSTQLKKIYPALNRFNGVSDVEIKNFISFLEEKGFTWCKDDNAFYNEKLEYSIGANELDCSLNNRLKWIRGQVEELKQSFEKSPKTYKQRLQQIAHWGHVSRLTLIAGILALGIWPIGGLFCFGIFLLSVKMQNRIMQKTGRWDGKSALCVMNETTGTLNHYMARLKETKNKSKINLILDRFKLCIIYILLFSAVTTLLMISTRFGDGF
jgi:hypothetical protein